MKQLETTRFTSLGCVYSVDEHGVIHQENAKPYVYDQGYVAAYAKPEYCARSLAISSLRLGWVLGVFDTMFRRLPLTLLDVGYGSGNFMREAVKIVPFVDGKEVADVPVPEGCRKVSDLSGDYDLMTFFDSLEHHPSLQFLSQLKTKLIAISVPWCHEGDSHWFDTWKHRKPDEHVHHFNPLSLGNYMESIGWTAVSEGHHEDVVRTPVDHRENILSMAFVRR
jgi:hypothetical protein